MESCSRIKDGNWRMALENDEVQRAILRIYIICCGFPQLYESLEGWKSVCSQAYKLKGIKGKISVFPLFLKLFFFYCSSFHGMMCANPAVVGRGNV